MISPHVVPPSPLQLRSVAALAAAFGRAFPDRPVDRRANLGDPRHNLIEGVSFDVIADDLLQGDGSELIGSTRRPAKFLAICSSTPLAIKVFGPFRKDPASLVQPWARGFSDLQFERKCPHGVGHGKPPNLDVLLRSPAGVTGMESKLLELLGVKVADFKPAYDADLRGARRATPWFRQMELLRAEPRRYRRLDAAQLVKHAFGLEYAFNDQRTMLAYLFWEPTDADAHPLFAEHRADLARLSSEVAGGNPAFVWISHPDLWRWWDHERPDMNVHLVRLRARYSVSVLSPASA